MQSVPAISSGNQIGLIWSAPTFNGGSEILDYSVWDDNAKGITFTKRINGLTQLSFIATSLTQGNTC